MAGARRYNVEDRIRELGEDPRTAFARAKADGMAGDAEAPTELDQDPAPASSSSTPAPQAQAGGLADQIRALATAPDATAAAPAPLAKDEAPDLTPLPLSVRDRGKVPPIVAPKDTGTLADTVEPMPHLAPTQVTSAPLEDVPTFGQTYQAARRMMRSDRSDFDEIRIRDGYAPIVKALGLKDSENPARFYAADPNTLAVTGSLGQPSDLATSANQGESMPFGSVRLATRDLQEKLIAAEIQKRRQKDPGFLKGVPDTVDGLHSYFMQGEKDKRASAREVTEHAAGLSGFAGQAAGGAVELFHDPRVLMTLPIGGGGTGALQTAARDALVFGVLEAANQPQVAANRAELGEKLTLGEAATNTVTAGVGGAVFGAALKGVGAGLKATGIPQAVGRGIGAGYDVAVSKVFEAMPASVQAKWAAKMTVGKMPAGEFFNSLSNRELLEFAHDFHQGKLTPDETAAGHVLERAQEIGETSPYQPGAAGDGTHELGLAQSIKALEDHTTPDPAELPSGPAGNGTGAASPAAATERPRAALSPAARPQPEPGTIAAMIERFKAKARGAESRFDDAANNPHSSADGRYQITDGTFRGYYKRLYGVDPGEHPPLNLKNNADVQERIMDALSHDNAQALHDAGEIVSEGNLYLMHFLGARDALRVLKADASTPIERILSEKVMAANEKVLRGKSSSQVAAWAHTRMSEYARTPAVPPRGEAGALDAAVGGDEAMVAQLNADALQLEQTSIGSPAAAAAGIPPMSGRSYAANSILVDADRFQFKGGGDEFGVNDRLKGVTQWNPMFAGRIVAWEDHAGNVFVADGHQRVGLAKRLESQGHDPISVDAITLREADGVSAQDARVYAALKNIAEGTGTAVDAAKVIRDAGGHVLNHLPPKSALVRDGAALARLSDAAFGAVYNDVIPADFAAVIGHLLPDRPEAHEAMVELLHQLDPANRGQAESIVRQGMAAGLHTEHQEELFGTRELVTSLMLERAKVLEKGLAKLRKLGLVHKTAANEADTLEAAGSKIAREQSAKEAKANVEAVEIVSRLAFSSGPVADALNTAARELAGGAKLGSVVDRFVANVRELDLAAVSREAPGNDASRLAPDGAGRGGDPGEEGSQLSAQPGDPEQPSLLGGAAAEEQPSLIDLEHATERFSDPDGQAVQQQADSLVHDLRAAVAAHEAPSEPVLHGEAPAHEAPAEAPTANDPLPELEPHLDDGDKAALAAAYDRPSFDAEASRRFVDDFTTALSKGLEHVGEAVREIIKKVQRAILAAAVVFNPNALGHLPAAAAQLGDHVKIEHVAELPAGSEAMSSQAKTVYQAMAPIAERTGKGFFIADKPGGKLHVFGKDGRLITSSAALYGKMPGDALLKHGARTLEELNAGPITPAGKYEIRFENSDYAGGKLGRLYEIGNGDPSYMGGVAIHSVYLGNAKEGRLGRLATDTAADNKISHGCINTEQPAFVEKIVPNVGELDHGLIFVLPEDPAKAAAMFPAEHAAGAAEHGALPAPAPGDPAVPVRAADSTGLKRRDGEFGVERQASVDMSPDKDRIIAAQKGADLEDLIARAAENQPKLAKVARAIEVATGAKFKDPGVKSAERVRQKFETQGYADAGELKDLSRGGFIVTSKAQAQRVAEMLIGNFEDVYDKGWKRIGGYYDRKLIVKFPNGGVAEIQLIPEQIEPYKFGEGHALYERLQDPSLSAEEYTRLEKQMVDAYDGLLAGSEFAADGKAFANSPAESSVPSSGALRATADDGLHLPPENTSALSGSDQATGRSSSSKNLMSSASPMALDMGAKLDPGKLARDRQLAELGAAAPLRAPGGVDQLGEIGLPAFDHADQPTFRLSDDGEPMTPADLLAELDADEKAIKAMRDCL
jgi:hypothetical protein